jgi:hypothetical protein
VLLKAWRKFGAHATAKAEHLKRVLECVREIRRLRRLLSLAEVLLDI